MAVSHLLNSALFRGARTTATSCRIMAGPSLNDNILEDLTMQLQYATGTVTGSKYLLRHGDATILVDCGLFQGFKQLRLRNWEPLPVAPKTVDAVVFFHPRPHRPQRLPATAGATRLSRPATRPRRTSCARSCSPTAAICRREEEKFANRHGFSKHQPALPLYTREDAERCLKLFAPRAPFSQDSRRCRPTGLSAGG